jgi:glutamate carboxypeptidase
MAVRRRFAAASALGCALIGQGAAAAERDTRVWKAAEAARPAELALLKQMVDIDSGTGDAAGARAIDDLLAPRLQALGAQVRLLPAEASKLGDNLVAVLDGPGRGRLLIICHVDTVFPAGEAGRRPYTEKGDKAFGPGVSDEKGGVAQAVTALGLLKQLGVNDYGRITLLAETSEETGSPGTHALIDKLSREADVELNMEPGDEPDAITVWRKGSTTFTITVHGRAAHAGVDPQDGRNAAVELIHQLGAVETLPHEGDGMTANLTTLKAGDRVNVIPDLATASVNVRVREAGQMAGVQATLDARAKTPAVLDTKVVVTSTPAFPPLPTNPRTQALAEQARALYAGLGRPLQLAGNGGASESALAHSAGAAALDGLGPVGGGFHSAREYLELGTVTPRLYLLTELLIALGRSPPPRAGEPPATAH